VGSAVTKFLGPVGLAISAFAAVAGVAKLIYDEHVKYKQSLEGLSSVINLTSAQMDGLAERLGVTRTPSVFEQPITLGERPMDPEDYEAGRQLIEESGGLEGFQEEYSKQIAAINDAEGENLERALNALIVRLFGEGFGEEAIAEFVAALGIATEKIDIFENIDIASLNFISEEGIDTSTIQQVARDSAKTYSDAYNAARAEAEEKVFSGEEGELRRQQIESNNELLAQQQAALSETENRLDAALAAGDEGEAERLRESIAIQKGNIDETRTILDDLTRGFEIDLDALQVPLNELSATTATTIMGISSAFQRGAIEVEDFESGIDSALSGLRGIADTEAQIEAVTAASREMFPENPELAETITQVEDLELIARGLTLGTEVDPEYVDILEKANEEMILNGQVSTETQSALNAARQTQLGLIQQEIAARQAANEAEQASEIQAQIADMQTSNTEMREKIDAYYDLVDAGYTAAAAYKIVGDAALYATYQELAAGNAAEAAGEDFKAFMAAVQEGIDLQEEFSGLSPRGGGGSSTPDTSAFDQITASLRKFADAQVKVTSGFEDTIAEIERFINVSGALQGEFGGLNQELRDLGLNENLIEMIVGMDPDEYEKRKNDLFIFDDQGTIIGMTAKLQGLNQALNTATIGEFINEQNNITISVGNQVVALQRLTAAGASYQAAYRAVQNTALAAAIATAKSSAQIQAAAEAAMRAQEMMDEFEEINEEELRRERIRDAIVEQNREFSNQAKIIDYITRNTNRLSEAQKEAILGDKDLQALILEPGIAPGALQTALDNANRREELELEIKKLTISGQQEIWEDGLSKAMEAFSAQEQELELKFQADTEGEQKIVQAAQEEIERLQFQLDDYEAGIEEIEDQEDLINEVYDKRVEALEDIEDANERITRQQEAQLNIAEALSRGDIAAAAQAAQEARSLSAENVAEERQERLERAREAELARTRSRGGMSRDELQTAIRDIENQIFRIEEDRLEPAEEAIRLADVRKQADIEALEVLGKTKTEWEEIANRVDLAVVNNYKFVDAMQEALDIVEKLIAELQKPKSLLDPILLDVSGGGGDKKARKRAQEIVEEAKSGGGGGLTPTQIAAKELKEVVDKTADFYKEGGTRTTIPKELLEENRRASATFARLAVGDSPYVSIRAIENAYERELKSQGISTNTRSAEQIMANRAAAALANENSGGSSSGGGGGGSGGGGGGGDDRFQAPQNVKPSPPKPPRAPARSSPGAVGPLAAQARASKPLRKPVSASDRRKDEMMAARYRRADGGLVARGMRYAMGGFVRRALPGPPSQSAGYAGGGFVRNRVSAPPQMFDNGGRVMGAGTSTSDSIPALLSDGEYVINAKAVDRIGVPNLDRLNNQSGKFFQQMKDGALAFARGGRVSIRVAERRAAQKRRGNASAQLYSSSNRSTASSRSRSSAPGPLEARARASSSSRSSNTSSSNRTSADAAERRASAEKAKLLEAEKRRDEARARRISAEARIRNSLNDPSTAATTSKILAEISGGATGSADRIERSINNIVPLINQDGAQAITQFASQMSYATSQAQAYQQSYQRYKDNARMQMAREGSQPSQSTSPTSYNAWGTYSTEEIVPYYTPSTGLQTGPQNLNNSGTSLFDVVNFFNPLALSTEAFVKEGRMPTLGEVGLDLGLFAAGFIPFFGPGIRAAGLAGRGAMRGAARGATPSSYPAELLQPSKPRTLLGRFQANRAVVQEQKLVAQQTSDIIDNLMQQGLREGTFGSNMNFAAPVLREIKAYKKALVRSDLLSRGPKINPSQRVLDETVDLASLNPLQLRAAAAAYSQALDPSYKNALGLVPTKLFNKSEYDIAQDAIRFGKMKPEDLDPFIESIKKRGWDPFARKPLVNPNDVMLSPYLVRTSNQRTFIQSTNPFVNLLSRLGIATPSVAKIWDDLFRLNAYPQTRSMLPRSKVEQELLEDLALPQLGTDPRVLIGSRKTKEAFVGGSTGVERHYNMGGKLYNTVANIKRKLGNTRKGTLANKLGDKRAGTLGPFSTFMSPEEVARKASFVLGHENYHIFEKLAEFTNLNSIKKNLTGMGRRDINASDEAAARLLDAIYAEKFVSPYNQFNSPSAFLRNAFGGADKAGYSIYRNDAEMVNAVLTGKLKTGVKDDWAQFVKDYLKPSTHLEPNRSYQLAAEWNKTYAEVLEHAKSLGFNIPHDATTLSKISQMSASMKKYGVVSGAEPKDRLAGVMNIMEDFLKQKNGGTLDDTTMKLLKEKSLVAADILGLDIKNLAMGGLAKTFGSDRIPAMLTRGEYVIKRSAVESFGVGNLDKINNGTYNNGSVYNYNLSVNVKSDSNPDQIARTVMDQIKRVDSQRIRGNRF